jgi:hypothetical protein
MVLKYDTYDDRETLKHLYWGMDLKISDIANEFGVSETIVRNAMSKHGIGTRGQGRRLNHCTYRQRADGYECWYDHTTVYVHQLLAISEGVDPEKVFSGVGGEWIIHHKNGIPWDNRGENIECVTRKDHGRKHYERGDIPEKEKEYSDQDLIEWIKSFKEELGYVPRMKDMDSCPGPHSLTYINRFGSWSKALLAAGFEGRQSYGGGE